MGKRRKSKQQQQQNSSSSSGSKPPKKNDTTTFDSKLATILLAKGLVTSPEESTCLAEAIICEIEESDLSREQALIASFEDYFSLTRDEATTILSSLLKLEASSSFDGGSGGGGDDHSSSSSSIYEGGRRTTSKDRDESEGLEEGHDDDDDDGEFIGEGECELCERYIRLTKHHLIPRSTWPKIRPKLTNAAYALSKNDVNKAGLVLGPGLHHMLEPLALAQAASTSAERQAAAAVEKNTIKGLLQITTNICGPCHAAVHRAHENIELANNYSTVELLLKDERIYKFAKWASKQRPGKHAV